DWGWGAERGLGASRRGRRERPSPPGKLNAQLRDTRNHLHAGGVVRARAVEVGIEMRTDAADEGPTTLGDNEAVCRADDEAMLIGGNHCLSLLSDSRGCGTEPAPHLGAREGEVAHQPLDHIAAHPILIREGETLRGSQSVVADSPFVVGNGYSVLHVAVR